MDNYGLSRPGPEPRIQTFIEPGGICAESFGWGRSILGGATGRLIGAFLRHVGCPNLRND